MTTLADVPGGFDDAAPRYDLLSGLNPGYRRHLASAAHTLARTLPANRPAHVLDLGCGSGRSTRALEKACLARKVAVHIRGVDYSTGMLGVARAKPWTAPVSFVQASLDSPDAGGPLAGDVDGAFAAYLFRNLSDPDAALQRVHRALAPGGSLVIVEYSVADSRRASTVWSAVCRGIVIPAATVVRGNPALYRYLRRSVIDFDGVGRFARRCRDAGFARVRHRTVPGWQRDILHVFEATKGETP